MYTVYVLRNPEGRVYIGQTGNLEKRLAEHNLGEGRWTSGKGPWELVETEEFDTREPPTWLVEARTSLNESRRCLCP